MDRDLIDRNELIEKLDPEYKKTVKLIKSGETHLDNLAEGYTEVYDLITHAPTIDAESTRHGHWKEIAYKHFDSPDCPFSEEIDEDTGWTFEWDSKTVCSVCGYRTNTYTHYCPDCGAKMDEEK